MARFGSFCVRAACPFGVRTRLNLRAPISSPSPLLPPAVGSCVRLRNMSDWEPQVVRIEKVVVHPDATALDVVTVLRDYALVVKRNEYKVDDLASYIPIDSILPDNEMFHFLTPRETQKYEENGEMKTRTVGPKYPIGGVPEKHRIIKAKKIRGIYSQGLLMPCPVGMKESDSVTEVLGLQKWEEQEEENVPLVKKGPKGAPIGVEPPPDGWEIPHYDINAVRKYIDCLKDGEEVVLTEKLHGSNGAFMHDGARLWVKSRNHYRKLDVSDMWWGVALRNDLENKLQQMPNMIFFGEVYGAVKGFRYDTVTEGGQMVPKVRFFDVRDLKRGRYLDFDERQRLIAELGLEAVPVLYRGPWLGKDQMYPLAEGPTTLGGKHVREGWVLNTAVERYEPLVGSRMQVKLVGEGYNLQK